MAEYGEVFDGVDGGPMLYGSEMFGVGGLAEFESEAAALADPPVNGGIGPQVPATVGQQPAQTGLVGGLFEAIGTLLKSPWAKVAAIGAGIYFLHKKGYLKEEQEENF